MFVFFIANLLLCCKKNFQNYYTPYINMLDFYHLIEEIANFSAFDGENIGAEGNDVTCHKIISE